MDIPRTEGFWHKVWPEREKREREAKQAPSKITVSTVVKHRFFLEDFTHSLARVVTPEISIGTALVSLALCYKTMESTDRKMEEKEASLIETKFSFPYQASSRKTCTYPTKTFFLPWILNVPTVEIAAIGAGAAYGRFRTILFAIGAHNNNNY
uniref:Uncharacterized protein n=1 Tax=Romanomermis culicivorax TaxID=13658 RepID=A0A915HVM7_ROMCU